jgi:hypothetical protein
MVRLPAARACVRGGCGGCFEEVEAMSEHRRARLLERATVELRPITRTIDWGSLDRIAAYRNCRREEMGEEAYAAMIQRDWEQ